MGIFSWIAIILVTLYGIGVWGGKSIKTWGLAFVAYYFCWSCFGDSGNVLTIDGERTFHISEISDRYTDFYVTLFQDGTAIVKGKRGSGWADYAVGTTVLDDNARWDYESYTMHNQERTSISFMFRSGASGGKTEYFIMDNGELSSSSSGENVLGKVKTASRSDYGSIDNFSETRTCAECGRQFTATGSDQFRHNECENHKREKDYVKEVLRKNGYY